MLQKPLDAYTTLWGYKRSAVLTRSEKILRDAQESIRKSQEVRVRLDKMVKDLEEKRKSLPIRPAPSLPIPDSELPPEPRGYESLLRKSS